MVLPFLIRPRVTRHTFRRTFHLYPHPVFSRRSCRHCIISIGKRREQRRFVHYGVLPLGTTPPISLRLNHDNETVPLPPQSPVKVTEDDVVRLAEELKVLLKDYSSKDHSRRDDVWLELRTGPQYQHIVITMEHLLQKNVSSLYQVWEHVSMASIFRLRLDVENFITQVEAKKLDVELTNNNRYDTQESKELWDHIDEQIATAKSWNAIIVRILLHRIPHHVVARPILPQDVTLDLIKVSTVHDELPDHYNECFNPYMGTTNRVYGIYYDNPKDERCQKEPIVVLCVSLQPRVPRSLRDIFCPVVSDPPKVQKNHVATFYSILNLQHYQFSKLKLGELLIQNAVRMLQDETKDDPANAIDTFVTLSPIPGFASWLLNEMDIYVHYCSDDFLEDEHGNGILRKKPTLHRTMVYLAKNFRCADEDIVTQISILLYDMNEKQRNVKPSKKLQSSKKALALREMGTVTVAVTPQIMAAVRYLLESMAAHYICHVKIGHTNGSTTMVPTQGNEHLKPSNGVARFHLQNGAQVFRINAFADVSFTGITDSFSVMVNYRYDLAQLAENQKRYAQDYTVAVHDYVKQQMQ